MANFGESGGQRLISLGREPPAKLPIVDPLMRASPDKAPDRVETAKLPDHVIGGGECAHALRSTTNCCGLQHHISLLAPVVKARHTGVMTDGDAFKDSAKETGQRLVQLREALGLSQTQMAERYGVGNQQTWSNYEKGRWLPPELALKIAAKDKVSLDWLYRGLTDMLPLSIAKTLGAIEPEHVTPRRKGSA